MPLIQSKSKKAQQENIKTEIAAGKPQKQAIAISYAVKRKNQRKHQPQSEEPMKIKKIAEGGLIRPTGPFKAKTQKMMEREEEIPKIDEEMDEPVSAEEEAETPKFAKGGRIPDEAKAENLEASRRDMGWGKIIVKAEGGEVPEHEAAETEKEEEMEHAASIASAIMARREAKKMADGGMIDIEENNEEEPNQFYRLNKEALDHNFDSDIMDMEQPEDSNEHGDDIEHDRHDRIAAIRRRMKKSPISR